MERIVITFTAAAQFRGASVADFNGQPKPLDEAALNALFPDVNASSFSRVTTLEEDLAAMTTAKESATTELETATSRVESLESQLSDTQTQLADIQTQLTTAQSEASSVPNLQSQLETALARIAELEAVPEVEAVGGVTPLTIITRLVELGKWPEFEAILSAFPSFVEKSFYAAQTIEASHPLFLAYVEEFKAGLDLTDDEFTDLLTP